MSGILACHPLAPQRPYIPWQRKVRIQLDELLTINNPDIRTRRDIELLRAKLKRGLDATRPPTRKCSDAHCTNQLHIDSKYKQCAFCRARKLRYERHRKRNA